MKIIFFKTKSFAELKPHEITYEGYRSKFFKFNLPQKLIIGPAKKINYEFDETTQDEIIKLIKNTFNIKAFLSFKSFTGVEESCIHEVKFADRFEDLVIVKKKKWLTCLNPNLFLHTVISIFLNLCKKGSAIICFDKQNFNNIGFLYELLVLLASNFEQAKIGENFVILEDFTEKNKKTALRALHYCFDFEQEVYLFEVKDNAKLIKFFEN